MPVFIDILWLVVGLVALYFGAEWLVGAAAKLAVRFGISPLVVGLTVVAFGTSSPELFVSLQFNFEGLPDMAVGNVVGSNICNIGLILGISALMYGLSVKAELIRRDMPILLITTIVFVWMIWDGQLARWEGIVLAVSVILYTVYCLWESKREKNPEVLKEFEDEFGAEQAGNSPLWLLIVMILGGLIALYFGAEWLKKGGVSLAVRLGVPSAVISLTLVAFATSVPELATSVVAAMKREGDIIIGNVIGSCIFNILCVMGFTAVITPMAVAEISMVDLAVMGAFTLALLPMMLTRRMIGRLEGALLLLGYFGYMAFLYVDRIAPATAAII
ncbi:MAG: calcium/sodium antiporter [Verrucomicrobiae bacterium]|nr:calcium/sodium antiporter [Verrucomicrobiae bacterium]